MGSRRKTRNFFRFILCDDIKNTGLRIPNKFTKDHRKKILLNEVLLVVSDGAVWALNWTISGDGKLWIKKGWREFAENYCLGLGYLLLFNYLGKSNFHVTIFDQSSCEINYLAPTKNPKSKKGISQSLNITQDDQMMDVEKAEENLCGLSSFQEKEDEIDLEMEEKKGWSCEVSRSSRELELATAFKSNNPFYLVKVNLSYFGSWGLYIPLQFLRRYLTKDEKCVDCVLHLSHGGNWGPVKCRDYNTYGKFYGTNWKKFSDENHLAVGDVCALELINEIENVLKVTIFRAQEDDTGNKA